MAPANSRLNCRQRSDQGRETKFDPHRSVLQDGNTSSRKRPHLSSHSAGSLDFMAMMEAAHKTHNDVFGQAAKRRRMETQREITERREAERRNKENCNPLGESCVPVSSFNEHSLAQTLRHEPSHHSTPGQFDLQVLKDQTNSSKVSECGPSMPSLSPLMSRQPFSPPKQNQVEKHNDESDHNLKQACVFLKHEVSHCQTKVATSHCASNQSLQKQSSLECDSQLLKDCKISSKPTNCGPSMPSLDLLMLPQHSSTPKPPQQHPQAPSMPSLSPVMVPQQSSPSKMLNPQQHQHQEQQQQQPVQPKLVKYPSVSDNCGPQDWSIPVHNDVNCSLPQCRACARATAKRIRSILGKQWTMDATVKDCSDLRSDLLDLLFHVPRYTN